MRFEDELKKLLMLKEQKLKSLIDMSLSKIYCQIDGKLQISMVLEKMYLVITMF